MEVKLDDCLKHCQNRSRKWCTLPGAGQPTLIVLLLEACMPETIAQVILKPGQLEHVRWGLIVSMIQCECEKLLPDQQTQLCPSLLKQQHHQ